MSESEDDDYDPGNDFDEEDVSIDSDDEDAQDGEESEETYVDSDVFGSGDSEEGSEDGGSEDSEGMQVDTTVCTYSYADLREMFRLLHTGFTEARGRDYMANK